VRRGPEADTVSSERVGFGEHLVPGQGRLLGPASANLRYDLLVTMLDTAKPDKALRVRAMAARTRSALRGASAESCVHVAKRDDGDDVSERSRQLRQGRGGDLARTKASASVRCGLDTLRRRWAFIVIG
jgi:hypothetical protein